MMNDELKTRKTKEKRMMFEKLTRLRRGE